MARLCVRFRYNCGASHGSTSVKELRSIFTDRTRHTVALALSDGRHGQSQPLELAAFKLVHHNDKPPRDATRLDKR